MGMTTARKVREAALCALMLAVSVVVLRASARHPSDLNLVDRVVLRVSAPLQGLVAGAARAARRAAQRYVFVVSAAHENQRLREDNARLRAELLAVQREKHHQGDLERLLGLQSRTAAESLAARVVGADTNAFFRVARIRLDRGGDVQPGMAVLAPEGVVGRIQRTYGPWSDVLLAVDAKSSIDVIVPRTGARGILRGAGARDRYRATVELEASADAIAVGDAIVTSGLGGAFPRDAPVGRVVQVGRRDVGLFQLAEVEPSVDFAKLEDVLVLVTPPPPEEPPLPAKERRVEPSRGVQPYR
jgi:rod shape-determining protein MreC